VLALDGQGFLRSSSANRLHSRITVTLFSCVTLAIAFAFGVAQQTASAFVSQGVSAHNGIIPGQPTHLTTLVRDHQMILRWRAPSVTSTSGVATDYLVIWQAPPVLPLTAKIDTHSTLTSYTSNLGAGTYKVEAKNKNGTGPPSKPVTLCGKQSTAASAACSPA
jgi:hypothetical protein